MKDNRIGRQLNDVDGILQDGQFLFGSHRRLMSKGLPINTNQYISWLNPRLIRWSHELLLGTPIISRIGGGCRQGMDLDLVVVVVMRQCHAQPHMRVSNNGGSITKRIGILLS